MTQFNESLPTRAGLALSDPNLLGPGSFIDGAFGRTRSSDADLIVTNPANGGIVRRVAEASDTDVHRALDAAEAAFSKWRLTSVQDRAKFMRRWHALVVENREDLARLITLENGKPLAEARTEIDYAASFIDWNVLTAAQGHGSSVVQREKDVSAYVTREPVGVCLLVTPWNFPAAMVTRKAAPALAAGCAIVVKPSELTPLIALALAELASRAGAPPGLFSVIATSRSGPVVELALQTPSVRLVSFTGSTRVGKIIAAKAAQRMVKTSLELGGHAPFIVYDDAHVETAVDGLISSKFRVSGQTCISPNRVYVQQGPTYDAFCTLLKDRMENLVMGNGLNEDVNLGPLISEAAVDRVGRHVDDAVERGATLVLGRETESNKTMGAEMESDEENGLIEDEMKLFFPPTLLLDVTDDMLMAKEETFGPVVGVLAFNEEHEVLRRANDNTEMGLAAYVYTKDGGRAMRAVRDLQFGILGVNHTNISSPATPFGGMKESGVGREGGVDALEPYTEVKYALMRF